MKKKRILVVDDDTGMTDAVKRTLEHSGEFQVREENFSERALKTALQYKPHLILLDWKMPILDGGEVADQIGKESELWDVPIIFITAFGSRAGKYGRPVLEKPFSQAELLSRVKQELDSA